MTEQNKPFPAGSAEMSKILGMTSDQPNSTASVSSAPAGLPAGLPIAENTTESAAATEPAKPVNDNIQKALASEPALEEDARNIKFDRFTAFQILKSVGPVVAIFVIGLFVYQFYFSDFSFQNLLPKNNGQVENASTTVPKQEAMQALQAANTAEYQAWLSQYYFDVRDPKITDPNTDNSGNGLTNFEKYLFGLNPKVYDTLGLGKPDGETLSEGLDPANGKPLSEKRKDLVDKYIDLELVANRIAAGSIQSSSQEFDSNFQGQNYNNSNFDSTNYYQNYDYTSAPAATIDGPRGPMADPSAPAEINQPVAPQSTQPTNSNTGVVRPNTPNSTVPNTSRPPVRTAQASTVTPASATTNLFSGQHVYDIDPAVPGKLEIPSLKISVPLIWTKDIKNFDIDLTKGVVHFPGTALPGDIGNSYISGHSSGTVFSKNPYRQIFASLGDLKDLASVDVTITLKNKKTVTLHYIVQSRKEYKPNDQEQFQNTGESILSLSTCWPVGSTAKRLVVKAKLSQTSK